MLEVTEPTIVAPPRALALYQGQPFMAPRRLTAPEGSSILEMLEAGDIGPGLWRHIEVWIGSDLVPATIWPRVRPKAGVTVYIRLKLAGGGDGGKNPLRAILMLAVVVVAAATGGLAASALGLTGFTGTLVSSVVAAGVTAVGMALINALVPPPQLQRNDRYAFDQQLGNPYAQLTGLRNQFAPGAPIPRVFGKRRMYPLLAARPYTENEGATQFLRMLLLVGYGPVKISDIRIGNTPLSAFAGHQVEVRQGWAGDSPITLFTRTVQELGLSVLLEPSVAAVRTTETATSEISIDVSFPQALVGYNAQGAPENRTVAFTVEWRPAAGGSWTPADWTTKDAAYGTASAGTLTCTDASRGPTVRSGRWSVPSPGQYEVRLTRTTAAGTAQQIDTAYWTVLRSIKLDTPIAMTGLSLIALRLQATAQLNGGVDTVNCLAEGYHPVWNGTSWSYQITRNPAWHYADVFRRRGTKTVLADGRLDLAAISAWATANDATAPNASEPRWTFDGVLEGGSIDAAARTIAGHGRAQMIVDGQGRYSVVRDVAQTVYAQVISPANSRNYRGRRSFLEIPHALKVRFTNPDKNYAEDEVIVYRDGYSEANAEKFDTLDMQGCSSATQAWREGRYHLAVLLLRREEHIVDMDIEQLRCQQGALVALSHDVISVGLGSGRVISTTDTGDKLTVTLGGAVSMEAGKSYRLRVRAVADATVRLHTVTTRAGDHDHVQIAPPPALANQPKVGDVWQFGEAGLESLPALVKAILPNRELGATVILTPYADGIHSADTGTIPAFQSYIATGVQDRQRQPAAPTVTIRSDESALERLSDGTLIERIAVSIAPPAAADLHSARWQVEARRTGSTGDFQPAFGAAGLAVTQLTAFLTSVVTGAAYDIRARLVSEAGVPGPWTTVLSHVVVGKTSPPATVTGLTATRTFDGYSLSWNANTDVDLDGYELRSGGTDWASATVLSRTPARTYLDVRTITGALTYRIRAVDVVGNLSAAEATLTVNAAAPTLPAARISGLVAIGVNRARFGRGERLSYWTDFDPSGVAGAPAQFSVSGSIGVGLTATFAAAGQVLLLTYGVTRFAVVPNERLGVSYRFEATRSASGYAYLDVRDGAGVQIATPIIHTWTGPQAFLTAGGGFTTMPNGAVSAAVIWVTTSNGAGLAGLNVADLCVTAVSTTQTVLPLWTPAPDADPLADVTGVNVAASIVGQAPAATDGTIAAGATRNAIVQASASSESAVAVTTSWADIVTSSLSGLLGDGGFELYLELDHQGNATGTKVDPGPPAAYEWYYAVEVRILSRATGGGDEVTLWSGTLSQSRAGPTVDWPKYWSEDNGAGQGRAQVAARFVTASNTKSGARTLAIQARRTVGTAAHLRRIFFRCFYFR